MRDGRFKPDLVAPGAGILSMSSRDVASPRPVNYCSATAADDNDAALDFKSGTSMSTPLVAGAMEYIRQYFVQGYYPSGALVAGDAFAKVPEALLRGVVLASSRHIAGKVQNDGAMQDLPISYPNYAIGFGMPVIDRALFMQGYTGAFANGLQVTKPSPNLPSFASGASIAHLYQFRCGAFTSDKSVHIVLTWTDPAGNPVAMNQIVNDLDLVVITGTPAVQRLGNNDDFPDTANTVEKITLPSCDQDQVVNVAVNPGRVVAAQPYALVINGNVAMGSLTTVVPGTFTFNSTRFSPLASSSSPLSGDICSGSAEVAIMPGRSPLSANPTRFAQRVASRRFAAALAMYLGVGLEAVSATFSPDFASVLMAFTCSAYVCGSASSLCYVSATDIGTALTSRKAFLALLPTTNPLSIVNWGNVSAKLNAAKSDSSARTISLAVLTFALIIGSI